MKSCKILLVIVLVFGLTKTRAQLIEDVLTFPHCPLCCERGEPGPPGIQGPPGNQGVSGEPGMDGAHGEPGAKGEVGFNGFKGRKGERGQMGNRGDPGIPSTGGLNIKGDPGQKGAKGEMGTRGWEGVTGDRGIQGAQGQKGVKGRKGESSVAPVPAFFVKLTTGKFIATPEVAFLPGPGENVFVAKRSVHDDNESKAREKRQILHSGPGEINAFWGISNAVPFNDVVVNTENGWKPDEYIFRAPIDGTYFFSTTIYKHESFPYIAAILYKNQDVLASTIDEGEQSDSATMTAIAKMAINDVAWVKLLYPATVYGHSQTTFSGQLIH